jgi:hypothetical protein
MESNNKNCPKCNKKFDEELFKRMKNGKYCIYCISCNNKKKIYKCEHGKQKNFCKECKGNKICTHDKVIYKCRLCKNKSKVLKEIKSGDLFPNFIMYNNTRKPSSCNSLDRYEYDIKVRDAKDLKQIRTKTSYRYYIQLFSIKFPHIVDLIFDYVKKDYMSEKGLREEAGDGWNFKISEYIGENDEYSDDDFPDEI